MMKHLFKFLCIIFIISSFTLCIESKDSKKSTDSSKQTCISPQALNDVEKKAIECGVQKEKIVSEFQECQNNMETSKIKLEQVVQKLEKEGKNLKESIKKLEASKQNQEKTIQQLENIIKELQQDKKTYEKNIESLKQGQESSQMNKKEMEELKQKYQSLESDYEQLLTQAFNNQNQSHLQIWLSQVFDKSATTISHYYDQGQVLANQAYEVSMKQYDQQVEPLVKSSIKHLDTIKKQASTVYDQHCRATIDPLLVQVQQSIQPHLDQHRPMVEKYWNQLKRQSQLTWNQFVLQAKNIRLQLIEIVKKQPSLSTHAQRLVDVTLGIIGSILLFTLLSPLLRFSYHILIRILGIICCCFCFGLCKRRKKKKKNNRKSNTTKPSNFTSKKAGGRRASSKKKN